LSHGLLRIALLRVDILDGVVNRFEVRAEGSGIHHLVKQEMIRYLININIRQQWQSDNGNEPLGKGKKGS